MAESPAERALRIKKEQEQQAAVASAKAAADSEAATAMAEDAEIRDLISRIMPQLEAQGWRDVVGVKVAVEKKKRWGKVERETTGKPAWFVARYDYRSRYWGDDVPSSVTVYIDEQGTLRSSHWLPFTGTTIEPFIDEVGKRISPRTAVLNGLRVLNKALVDGAPLPRPPRWIAS